MQLGDKKLVVQCAIVGAKTAVQTPVTIQVGCCCCKCQRSCQGVRGGSGGGSRGGRGRAGRWLKEGSEEMKTGTSRGCSQRSVGWAVQLNRIVCSAVLHSGHIGEDSLPILNR